MENCPEGTFTPWLWSPFHKGTSLSFAKMLLQIVLFCYHKMLHFKVSVISMIMSTVQTDIKKGPHSCRVTESWNLQTSIGCHQIRAEWGALETQAAANTWKSFPRFPCCCSWLVASGHSALKPRWPSNQFAVLSINQMRDYVMMLTIIAAITVQSLNFTLRWLSLQR